MLINLLFGFVLFLSVLGLELCQGLTLDATEQVLGGFIFRHISCRTVFKFIHPRNSTRSVLNLTLYFYYVETPHIVKHGY